VPSVAFFDGFGRVPHPFAVFSKEWEPRAPTAHALGLPFLSSLEASFLISELTADLRAGLPSATPQGLCGLERERVARPGATGTAFPGFDFGAQAQLFSVDD
jgi:hypothetical protein